MALPIVQVDVKAREDEALGRFLAEALGWGVSSEGPGVTNIEPVGFDWPDATAVCIDVVTVPDPETVRCRVHLDLATTSAVHQTALVARLEGRGARRRESARISSSSGPSAMTTVWTRTHLCPRSALTHRCPWRGRSGG